MPHTRILLCWAYALIAVAALVVAFPQFLPFPPGGLAGFWAELKFNHVGRGIGADLAFFLLAAALFMISEARRLKIRFVWLYVFLAYMFAVSVMFPIFMIMRERAMARSGEDAAKPTVLDLITAAAITGVVTWQTWFLLQ